MRIPCSPVSRMLAILGLAASLVVPAARADNPDVQGPGQVERKLDPLLRPEMIRRAELARAGQPAEEKPASPLVPVVADAVDGTRIPCFVHLAPGAPTPPGIAGTRRHGDLVLAELTFAEIERVAREKGTVSISVARRLEPSLDISAAEIGATDVQSRSGTPPSYSGYTGAGVVVGVVDSGVDVNHDDFRNDNGTTRLVTLWDQTVGAVNSPAGYGYGREWTAAEINAGSCTETDTNGHGTHVIGTAAGNGQATGNGQPAYTYVGIAPEATLVMVKTNMYSSGVTDGIDYIFGKAAALGLPAVVNLSLGNQWGPHDGWADLEQAIASMTGPGRVVVAAAGNEQANAIHAEASVASGANGTITLVIPAYSVQGGAQNDTVSLDGYAPDGVDMQVSVTSPNGHTVGPAGLGDMLDQDTADGGVQIQGWGYDGSSFNLYVQIYDKVAAHPPVAGTWTLTLHNASAASSRSAAGVDFWIPSYSFSAAPHFGTGMTAQKLVGSPACGDSVIAVAAYTTRLCWTAVDGSHPCYAGGGSVGELASFSNHGPRRDGVLKPDVAAPGKGIGSALSSDFHPANAWILADGVHTIMQGTSMASPHVTGVVALMMQARGALSARHAIDLLQQHGRSDAYATGVPNASWGGGKVDAIATTAIPSPVLLQSITLDRTSRGVRLRWQVSSDVASLRFAVERGAVATQRESRGESGPGPEYEFFDEAGAPEAGLLYWLRPLDGAVDGEPFGPFAVDATAPLGDPAAARVPLIFSPAPNPSAGRVRVGLYLPEAAEVRASVLDAGGRIVRELPAQRLEAGTRDLEWDGRDAAGHAAASGLYRILVTTGRHRASRPVLLFRRAGN